MHHVLILGAGKIGSLITTLLSQSGQYRIYLGDINTSEAESHLCGLHLENVDIVKLDASNKSKLKELVNNNNIDAIISGLPYFCNPFVVVCMQPAMPGRLRHNA